MIYEEVGYFERDINIKNGFDKLLAYSGGHIRSEDVFNCSTLIETAYSTISRELNEELGIFLTVGKDNECYIIYTPKSIQSRKHFAICFIIEIDDRDINDIKIDLSEEFIKNRKRFVSKNEVILDEYEEWSQYLINHIIVGG